MTIEEVNSYAEDNELDIMILSSPSFDNSIILVNDTTIMLTKGSQDLSYVPYTEEDSLNKCNAINQERVQWDY